MVKELYFLWMEKFISKEILLKILKKEMGNYIKKMALIMLDHGYMTKSMDKEKNMTKMENF